MKYSIITPVFNRADCVSRCIESVIHNIKQGTDIEHVIVDDGSSDGSDSIIRNYADKYDHIKYIKFDSNQGTNAARNAAIQVASGEFSIILDSDDYFVDDAIHIINSIVASNPDFVHYCFAPDDMQEKYSANPLLQHEQSVLQFEDFLLGRLDGDYIHVVNTLTLKKFPFDPSVRIYEGVFFLRFYKEASNVLFTNKVVTIRERGRNDSVSYEFLRTDKNIIKRQIQSALYNIEWFVDDYRKSADGLLILYRLLNQTEENLLLVSDYEKANHIKELANNYNVRISKKYIVLSKLHLGWCYFNILRLFLFVKYRVLRKKLSY